MRALVFDGNLSLKEIPKPKAAGSEALVRVSVAGICKTDVEITKGYMGFQGVPGHEFVGVVEEAPNRDLIGRRVVGEINAGCGECRYCARGLERHCPNRTTLGILGRDGALAEYLTLPVSNLLPVPDNVTDEIGVFTEPLAAAVEILEQSHIQPNSRALVIGDGKLGLLVSMVLRLTGGDTLLVGKHPDKLALFSAQNGSTMLLERFANTSDRYDFIVEASGSPSGWDLAMSRINPRGVIVLKSTYHGSITYNSAQLVIDEITVMGSRCGPFAPALRLLERGLIDPSALISAVIPFSDAEEAFRIASGSQSLKVLLKM